jgi:maltose-binding protein MalE
MATFLEGVKILYPPRKREGKTSPFLGPQSKLINSLHKLKDKSSLFLKIILSFAFRLLQTLSV